MSRSSFRDPKVSTRGPAWWKCLGCGASGTAGEYEAHFVIDVEGRGWCRVQKERACDSEQDYEKLSQPIRVVAGVLVSGSSPK